MGDAARKTQCATLKTTLAPGARAPSDCVCVRGTAPDSGAAGVGQCKACDAGKFLGSALMILLFVSTRAISKGTLFCFSKLHFWRNGSNKAEKVG